MRLSSALAGSPPATAGAQRERASAVFEKRYPPSLRSAWENERAALEILNSHGFTGAPQLLEASRTSATGMFLRMSFVDGTHLVADESTLFQLGSTLSRLHYVALPQDLREYRWQLSKSSGVEAMVYWTGLVDKVSDQVVRLGARRSAMDRIRYSVQLEGDQYAALAGPSLIHRDLAPRNILINVDGIWLVDWEAATIGHPDLDVARLFGAEIEDSEVLREAFWEGYGPVHPARRTPEARRFFRLLFSLEMVRYFSGIPSLSREQESFLRELIGLIDTYG